MLDLHYHEGVAHIAIDDGKANAVGFAYLEAVNGALDEIDANEDAKAVVISGRPGMFSAGFDLKVMTGQPERAGEMVQSGGKLALRLFTHKLPVVAGVTGHAMAQGIFLGLGCDTRIGAAGDFKHGMNETAIGMVLPIYAYQMAVCRLNPLRLSEAFIQAKLYNPEEALEVGFLDELVDADKVVDRALEKAAELGALPQAAYHGNKMLLRKQYIEVIEPSLATPQSTVGM